MFFICLLFINLIAPAPSLPNQKVRRRLEGEGKRRELFFLFLFSFHQNLFAFCFLRRSGGIDRNIHGNQFAGRIRENNGSVAGATPVMVRIVGVREEI